MTDEPSVTSNENSTSTTSDRSVATAANLRRRARARALKAPGFDWKVLKAYRRDAGRPGMDQQTEPRSQPSPLPQQEGWRSYLESGTTASADFMENVEDLPDQERELP